MLQSKKTWLIGTLLLFMFICYAVFELFMPYSGDDLAYIDSTVNYVNERTVWHMPFKWAGHWLGSNGRFANMIFLSISPIFPHWLMALLNAIFIMMMIYFIVVLCNFRGKDVTGKVFVISIITFAFCWWDSMQVYDCIYNYILSTALGLIFIKGIIKNKAVKTKWGTWGLVLLSFVAGGMHEAMSVSLLCGIVAYAFMNRKFYTTLTRSHRMALKAFACGVVIVFFAPGIWIRFGGNITPDDPLHILLLKSDFLALGMLAMLCVGMCFAPWRKKIIAAAHTPWIIFVVASIASMCFSAVSGIIGRSGWFAQVFALIAIVKWANDHNFRINRILGGILSTTLIAAIVMHLVEVTRWQVKVGKEVEIVTEMYKKSSRGQVFFDATWDNQLPWWNLNKNRGVPDADDLYLLATFSDYYGKSGNPLVVLPSEVSNIDFSNMADNEEVRLTNGDIIKVGKINSGTTYQSERENISIYLINDEGKDWVVTPFELERYEGVQLNHYTPCVIDPGDRLTPLE